MNFITKKPLRVFTKKHFTKIKTNRIFVEVTSKIVFTKKMADSNEFDGFINVFGDRHKSFVWEHFLFNKETKQSKCRHCQNVLKVVGGSTTGMRTHLKSIHAELISEFANKSANESFQDDQEVIDIDENDDKIQELNLDPVEAGQIESDIKVRIEEVLCSC